MPEVTCNECGKIFNKPPSQMRSKDGLNFCSRSCSASKNNKLGKNGVTRRSKLEGWLETRIKETFPDLEVHYNRKDRIGSELDIFIPSLNLAIEINGTAHYKKIWTEEVLKGKQEMDEQKRIACKEAGIELVEVNTTEMKDFKSFEFLKIVEMVLGKIKERAS